MWGQSRAFKGGRLIRSNQHTRRVGEPRPPARDSGQPRYSLAMPVSVSCRRSVSMLASSSALGARRKRMLSTLKMYSPLLPACRVWTTKAPT